MSTVLKMLLSFSLFACLLPAQANDFSYREDAISLSTATGKLQGTLMLPQTEGKLPLVLIIAGSGPTDRDGNNPLSSRSDNLKLLAESLASAGIASVRYDKRGIAASVTPAFKEADMRFDTYVQDAQDWLQLLKTDVRFSRLIVAGHSEGSLIGMLAARQAHADAFISIAGPAKRASELLQQQMNRNMPPEMRSRNDEILHALESGQTVDSDIPDALRQFYRPGIQAYLISWFRYVPAIEFAKLEMPCEIVQGDTDLQVDPDQAQALKATQPRARLDIIPGMNHVLKLASGTMQQQLASYRDPGLPLAPELGKAINRFVLNVATGKAE
jgi:alpha-beta hydrolase superfamily lysophospholipase